MENDDRDFESVDETTAIDTLARHVAGRVLELIRTASLSEAMEYAKVISGAVDSVISSKGTPVDEALEDPGSKLDRLNGLSDEDLSRKILDPSALRISAPSLGNPSRQFQAMSFLSKAYIEDLNSGSSNPGLRTSDQICEALCVAMTNKSYMTGLSRTEYVERIRGKGYRITEDWVQHLLTV